MKFYEKQGIHWHKGYLPVVGHFKHVQNFEQQYHPDLDLVIAITSHDFGPAPPKITGLVLGSKPCLIINSAEICNELYFSKNKYFDKHPFTANLTRKVLGQSIVFSSSNTLWASKRKVISASLYKEKLIEMTKIMKEITKETMLEWEKEKTIDIVEGTNNLLMKVILACIFGRKNENPILEQNIDGVLQKQTLGSALLALTGKMKESDFQLHLLLFPELSTFNLTQFDKVLDFNSSSVRNFIRDLLKERRYELEQKIDLDKKDFITMLLQDEIFRNNDEMIIDECVTFFIAGSQTTAVTIANIICYMKQNVSIHQKIMQELRENFKSFGKPNQELVDELNMETIEPLHYLKLCFYESLRIEPPASLSSTVCLTQNQNICGININGGDMMFINIYQIHHDEEQWKEHNKYIPERFDPQSQYYLTPKGKTRNPAAFQPFFGGKRVCLGKTFAETGFKFIMPLILNSFDFEFVDQNQKDVKPQINGLQLKKSKVMMKLKKLN